MEFTPKFLMIIEEKDIFYLENLIISELKESFYNVCHQLFKCYIFDYD
jgi:hypothetical protein